jgi:hypothetical protein
MAYSHVGCGFLQLQFRMVIPSRETFSDLDRLDSSISNVNTSTRKSLPIRSSCCPVGLPDLPADAKVTRRPG